MHWKQKKGEIVIAATSIALGAYLLSTEVIKNDPVSLGVIPGVSNALIGSLFIIKGFMWGKSSFARQTKPIQRVDYFGIGASIFTFTIAAKLLQTGVLYSKNGWWFHLEGVERYGIGGFLVIVGFYMLYHSIEYLRHR